MNWLDTLRAKTGVAADFIKSRSGGILSALLKVVVILALGSYLWSVYGAKAKLPENQWSTPPQIREVVKIQRVMVPGPKEVVTIEKEKVVEKLKLPDEVAKNPDVQVIATAEIPAHRASTDVVATLNTQTGEGGIIAKPRKPPFFEFVNEKEIGVRYGVSTKGNAADVFGRWDFVRVGGASVGVYGEAGATDQGRTQAKAQLSVSYKW